MVQGALTCEPLWSCWTCRSPWAGCIGAGLDLQVLAQAVDDRSVGPKSRSGFVAVATAVAAAIAGVAVVVRGAERGWMSLHGVRLAMFVGGVLIFAVGVGLFLREIRARRRARIEAIAALLPKIGGRRRWALNNQMEDSWLDDFEGTDDLSERVPMARAEIRAATRALLVSLEEEMRRDGIGKRRSARPACRRARLRVAGRAEAKRRHPRVRSASIPS